MKYALVNGIRSNPRPKVRGKCIGCSEEVISRCGQHVVWHWAHRSRRHCDPWWEPETEWHREWKGRFPQEWQEVVQFDPITHEKHIADVKTGHGVVVEFQRSSIDPAEVAAREAFYQRLVWVIDGSRGELDPINFTLSRSRPDESGMVAFHWLGRGKLFHRWHTCTPVFVDFGQQYGFWRICKFEPITKKGVALLVDRALFTDALSQGKTDFSKNGGPASL